MKICFISYLAYPLFNQNCKETFGGAEVQLFNLGMEIANNSENEVVFIVGNFGQKNQENFGKIKTIRSISVKKRSRVGMLQSAIVQIIKMAKAKADIYVCRSAGPGTGLAAFYCKLFNKKFIYMTAHEWDCSGEYIKDNGISGKFFKYGLKNSDIVITQNEKHKKMLEDNFNIKAEILRSGYNIPKEKTEKDKFFLWVSRLDEWKQPEIILNLAAKFSKYNFVMIAPTANNIKYAENIKEKADKIKNINFIEGLSLDKTNEYFSKAKFFINTSRYEGFPNTFVQAAMYGVPIISLSVNPDSIINNFKIGFFAENKPNNLAEFIENNFTDNDLYNILSINAYDYALANHDIKKIAKNFLSIIKKV